MGPLINKIIILVFISGSMISDGWSHEMEWHEVGPWGGGAVRDFAFDPYEPDRVYLTSDMVGTFVSNDAGDHWQWSSYGAASQMGGIAVDPLDPEILYTVGPIGIFKSVDRAMHWELIYSRGNGYEGINNETFGSLRNSVFGVPGQSVSVSRSGILYVSTSVGDIIISRDKGKTFKKVATGGKSSIKNIVIAGENNVVAALSREGIYLSSDEGYTWENTLSPSSGSLLALAGDPVKNNVLFALIGKHSNFTASPHSSPHYPAYLYRSLNGGKKWELIHSFEKLEINKDRRIMDVSEQGTIIILSAYGPLRSVVGTGTWTLSQIKGLEDDGYIYLTKERPVGPLSVYADPRKAGRWYMTNMSAAFRSDDDGRTWHYKVKGIREQAYWYVKVNPANPDIVIASDMDHGLIRSDDGGITWRDILVVDVYEESDQLRFSPQDNTYSVLYALFLHPYPFIAKSIDKGETWSVLKRWQDKKRMSMKGLCLTRDGKYPAMFVGEPGAGIWVSRDEGKSWMRKSKGLPSSEEMGYIQFLESDSRGHIYVGIASDKKGKGGIFKSQDGGESWFAINSGIPLFVRRGSFEIDPNNPDILWVGSGNSIFRSVNGGKNWEKKIGNLYCSAILIEPGNSDIVYVASYTGGGVIEQYAAGIYKSVDGGNYFTKVSGNLFRTIGSNYRVIDLEYGWRGQGGIWAAPDGGGLIYLSSSFSEHNVK